VGYITSLKQEIEKAKEIKIEHDAHNFKRRLISALKKLQGLTEENREEIFSFYNEYCKKEGLGIGRKEKVLSILRRITELVPSINYGKLSEKDLVALKIKLNEKEYSPHTIDSYFSVLKTFVGWRYPKSRLLDSREWKIGDPYKKKQLDPSTLPTEEQIMALLKAGSKQQRAYLTLLVSGWLRCEEAIALKRENIVFKKPGISILNVKGKTGRRSIVLPAGPTHILKEWYDAAAHKSQKDFFLHRKNGSPWMYVFARRQLQLMSVAAGFGKWKEKSYKGIDVHPHLFRHFGITNGFNDSKIPDVLVKKRAWGRVTSSMESVYTHLTMSDQERVFGNGDVELKPYFLSEKVCSKCETVFSPLVEVCSKCNQELDMVVQSEKERNLFVEKESILEELIEEKIAAALEERKN